LLGGTRIRLLEAIDRYGSIMQAALAVPLSYKATWDAVDAMVFEKMLLERATGVRHGSAVRRHQCGGRSPIPKLASSYVDVMRRPLPVRWTGNGVARTRREL
jgi:hypothetical protein